MEVFEYIRTSFHVMKAFVTQDKLLYLGLGVLGLFIIWSVLSLIFSHESKCMRVWRKMEKSLSNNNITPEVYFEFSKNFQKLPTASARKWKKYERTKSGKPSDYLTQSDMLDSPISGGMRKQNRSIMKFAIAVVTVFSFLLSLASLGGNEPLTAQIVCEALLTPFILFMLYRANYYVYTIIRQHQYCMAVEEFHDLLDLIDSKIDINEIFEGNETALDMNSNCYVNGIYLEKEEPVREQLQTLEKKEPTIEKKVKAEPEQPVIEVEPLKPTEDNKRIEIVEPEVKQQATKTAEKDGFYRNKSGHIEIRNQEEFVDALGVVEKLLGQTETAPEERDIKTKRVAELMEAMNKFRNKNRK